jgi:hypothetical protein
VTLEQLFLQLGVCGAMLLVGWRIATQWLTYQREAERERTAAIAKGLFAITELVTDHASADQAAHSEQGQRLAAIETQLSIRIKTPARGIATEVVRRTDGR